MRSSRRDFNHTMSEPLLVITTLPDAATAEGLATALVGGGLAACVNVSAPVTSVYRWEDRTERDSEVMLTIKTTRERYAALEAAIVDGHPYELPEIIAVPITGGLSGYLAWIDACTNT
jgi:periplasmic divalent cation tolerance protein